MIGYEILGRMKLESETVSLGSFFTDSSIPDEYKLEVDHKVLTQALDLFTTADDDLLILLIMMPISSCWIMEKAFRTFKGI